MRAGGKVNQKQGPDGLLTCKARKADAAVGKARGTIDTGGVVLTQVVPTVLTHVNVNLAVDPSVTCEDIQGCNYVETSEVTLFVITQLLFRSFPKIVA